MFDPRTPLFDALRPHLRDGWQTGLIDEVHGILDDLGADRAPKVIVVQAPKPPTGLSFAQQQIDLDLLDLAFPANSREQLAKWVEPTQTACVRWGIDTFREVSSFLANINIESAGLTRMTESLNYSVGALIARFGRHRISIADANRYGRGNGHAANQEMLANILYGGAWGLKNLGNEAPGDGWKHRGFGPKQITGKANQQDFADAMGMSLEEIPAYLRTPEGGMMGAGWFWKSHNLDEYAATPGLADDRRKINGGANGLAEVEASFKVIIDELLRREAAI
jgi:putative chitinase